MVRKTRGWGVNFWASENWSGRVHFEGHSPEWRVLSKLRVQPCTGKIPFSHITLIHVAIITASNITLARILLFRENRTMFRFHR